MSNHSYPLTDFRDCNHGLFYLKNDVRDIISEFCDYHITYLLNIHFDHHIQSLLDLGIVFDIRVKLNQEFAT